MPLVTPLFLPADNVDISTNITSKSSGGKAVRLGRLVMCRYQIALGNFLAVVSRVSPPQSKNLLRFNPIH